MASTGQLLRLRLFLEGQEVPVVSANVHAAINSPATASIQVIATDRLLSLRPRTLVHLFFYDYYEEEPLAADRESPPAISRSDENIQEIGQRYRLLFSGEIANIGFTRTPGSRSAVLECVDFTSYWSQARHYFKEMFSLSTEQGRVANFVAASVSTYDSWFKAPGGEVVRALQSKPVTHKDMTGLLGGIVHLMEIIGGVYKGGKQFRGINDFFNIAELRLGLMQMIGALEADDTSAKLLNQAKYRRYLTRTLQQLGATASFRDIINVVLQIIRHQTIPNPAAMYRGTSQVPPPKGSTVTKHPPAADKARLKKAAGHLKEAWRRCQEIEAALLNMNSVQGEDYTSQIIRFLPPVRGTLVSGTPDRQTDISVLRTAQLSLNRSLEGAYGQMGQTSNTSRKKLTASMADLKNKLRAHPFLVRPTLLTSATGLSGIIHLMRFCQNLAKKLLAFNLGKVPDTKERTKLPRLYNTLVLPDCWFVPPPRCNVLFPELYNTFNFSRNFMAEITRLQLTTTSEFLPIETPGIVLPSFGTVKQVYHAPKLKTQVEQTGSGAATRAARVLLPHEVYTGIVPHFEWMGNIKQMRVAEEGSKKFEKLGYAQRLANFLFFRKRFSARSLALQGKFNPHVVAGLPGLVIDRFLSPEQAELYQAKGITEAERVEEDGNVVSPTQYLGMITSVAHNVNQGGGSTVVTMSQVRTHDEEDEYLDADIRTVRKKTGSVSDATDANGKSDAQLFISDAISKLRALEERVHGFTRDEIFAKVVDITDDIAQARSLTRISKIKAACTRARKAVDKGFKYIQDLPLEEISTTEDGTLKRAEAHLNFGKARRYLAKVAGVNSVSSYKSVTEKVPAEEIIRPPWFASVYTNPLIGDQVYQPLLGISAITDELDVRTTAEGQIDKGDNLIKESERLVEIAERLDANLRPGEISNAESVQEHKDLLAQGLYNAMFNTPNLDSGASIQKAVDHLVRTYAYTKMAKGISAHSFVRQYHRRPIATMLEIFGDEHDLGTRQIFDGAGGGGRIVGFHENAYGDVDPMAGLTDKEWPPAAGKKPRKKVQGDLDPRRERYQAVQKYVAELQASSALRG